MFTFTHKKFSKAYLIWANGSKIPPGYIPSSAFFIRFFNNELFKAINLNSIIIFHVQGARYSHFYKFPRDLGHLVELPNNGRTGLKRKILCIR